MVEQIERKRQAVISSKKYHNVIGNTKSHIKDSYARTYGESPIFEFKNAGAIATTKEVLFDFHRDTPATAKYGAFNSIRISNDSDENIILYPNQNRSRAIFLASGTVTSVDRKTIPALRSVIVYNSSATSISANEIRIEVWKEGVVMDSAVADIHKMIVRGLFKRKSGLY